MAQAIKFGVPDIALSVASFNSPNLVWSRQLGIRAEIPVPPGDARGLPLPPEVRTQVAAVMSKGGDRAKFRLG